MLSPSALVGLHDERREIHPVSEAVSAIGADLAVFNHLGRCARLLRVACECVCLQTGGDGNVDADLAALGVHENIGRAKMTCTDIREKITHLSLCPETREAAERGELITETIVALREAMTARACQSVVAKAIVLNCSESTC